MKEILVIAVITLLAMAVMLHAHEREEENRLDRQVEFLKNE